jgi:hypothetical protein
LISRHNDEDEDEDEDDELGTEISLIEKLLAT